MASGTFCCLIIYLPQVLRQGVNFSPIPAWTSLWEFFICRQSCWKIWVWFRWHLHGSHTLELDSSFDDPDLIVFKISLGFQCTVSTHSNSSKLQLAPSIRSCMLFCLYTFVISLVCRMLAYKLTVISPVIQQHLYNTIKETFPRSEASLHGLLNWNLVQVQQQPKFCLSIFNLCVRWWSQSWLLV